jgi:hypothetical protein
MAIMTEKGGRPGKSPVHGSVLSGEDEALVIGALPKTLTKAQRTEAIGIIRQNRHLEAAQARIVARYVQMSDLFDALVFQVAESADPKDIATLTGVDSALARLERGLGITASSRKWNLSASQRGPRASISEAVSEAHSDKSGGRTKPALRLA